MRKIHPQCKIILHVHSDWLVPLDHNMISRQFKDVDLIVGVSDFITRRVRERFPEVAPRCITIYNGGSLYLDEGRPLPGLFDESVRNLRDVEPTVYFNVPRGYEELVKALARDRALAERFFSPRLRLLFYAAASLSQPVANELARIAIDTCGERVLLVTGLGSTETAPMAICRPWESDLAPAIGLPVPGVEVKLIPTGDKYEVRVKGPNVTPGYWRDPEKTKAAFDEDGYYRMGDGSFTKRFLYSAKTAVWYRRDNGTWGPNYANVAGNFVSGGISNLYYPSQEGGFEKTTIGALTVTAEGMIGSELIEFLPDIEHHFLKNRRPKP